jgi:hypothetical protein
MLQKAVSEFSIPSSKIKDKPETNGNENTEMEQRLYDIMINLSSC